MRHFTTCAYGIVPRGAARRAERVPVRAEPEVRGSTRRGEGSTFVRVVWTGPYEKNRETHATSTGQARFFYLNRPQVGSLRQSRDPTTAAPTRALNSGARGDAPGRVAVPRVLLFALGKLDSR